MEVTRTTLPGTGVVHHCVNREGRRFGVLVERQGRRLLMVYGPDDLDVPYQTIAMDPDEADQFAEILHTRSVADRLTALERRLALLTGERP